jgi:hypothetical protein
MASRRHYPLGSSVRKALEFKSHGDDALPAHNGRATKHYNRAQLASHNRETGVDRLRGLPIAPELLSGAKGVIVNKVTNGKDFSYEMSVKAENGHEAWVGNLTRQEYDASLKTLSGTKLELERRHDGEAKTITKGRQVLYNQEVDGPRLR